MQDHTIERIQQNPKFQELVKKKSSLSWLLSIVMLVIYYGFILMVAFSPATLGKSLSGGVTTIGIPIGILIIVSAFVITGIYVRRANTEFDQLTREVVEDAKK
jgi:uncharacterized membrane protein (DUF485 family)